MTRGRYVVPPKFTFVFFAGPAALAAAVLFGCAKFPKSDDGGALLASHG